MTRLFNSTANCFLSRARRGALLLALGAAGPAAWGQSFGPVSTYNVGTTDPNSVALGDMNGDGRLDIVTVNPSAASVGVLLGQVGGGFGNPTFYPAGGPTTAPLAGVAVGDLNADGRLDIVMSSATTNAVAVLLGQAAGGFASAVFYSTGAFSGPAGLTLGDVNRDGRLDIVTANLNSSTVGVLLGQAGGTFAPAMQYGFSSTLSFTGVALGDMNGDSWPDIVTVTAGATSVGVLLGQAAGGFAAATQYPTGANSNNLTNVTNLVLSDVNQDGRLDIVTANYRGANVAVLLGQATGGFGAAISYSTGSTPLTAVVGDVNGDGQADIVTANFGASANTASVLLGQPGGTFAAAVQYNIGSPGIVRSIALGDVNGDRRLDIVTTTTNTGSGTAGVFLNTGTYTPLSTARTATAVDITLSPNPAHDAFTVSLPAGAAATPAELLNALGQVVRRPAAAGAQFTVETAGLAPGVYSLHLSTGAGSLTKRVVVE
ncbi:T9SS type A sorting domain-containing protein [Hymenobacter properus]|uniref:T9SS type A sorting domain-containing protein n=1 Tax=Hymenobacter properus TaxID=2791026 RepID=A0A931FNQ6_9BACT|nr:T9SS type A sorting domain-containing protein [Hymenobacter properus]MBF9142889.1 T9SS type A sorting domain-containing protein [Hymenobacter properus]MBR7721696.1 T9SS type A sorting domain-containing protein [Microvirga sp. SRT04]